MDPVVLRKVGPGAPLPAALRARMEGVFGADFSAVRVHVGPQAGSIGAIAFAAGADLYFTPGSYRPETAEGRRLIGHELAHVVQQRQGRVRAAASGLCVVQDPALEAEAERMARRVEAEPPVRALQAMQASPAAAAPANSIQPFRHAPRDQPNKYKSRQVIMDRRDRRMHEAEERRRKFLDLDRYIRNVVGPWATQARIAQIIAEDFDALGHDKTLKTKPSMVSFGVKGAPKGSQPVLGHARFGYVAPSRIKGRKGDDPKHNRAIYRGFVEQEFSGGAKGGGGPAVRIYVTVASEAKVNKDGTSDYKDIQQVAGRVKIYTGTQANPILWVNAGQPLRAIKWYEKYKVQDASYKPLIRSFLISNAAFREISKNAGLEAEAGRKENRGRSFNVDRHYASDQFGVRGSDLRKLSEAAIPGSLITYTDNPAHVTKRTAGRIESPGVLRTRLGVPQETIQGIWVDPVKGDFADKKVFGRKADGLMDAYAIWTGQDIFLSDKMKSIPIDRRRRLMADELRAIGKFIPAEYWERIERGEVPADIAKGL